MFRWKAPVVLMLLLFNSKGTELKSSFDVCESGGGKIFKTSLDDPATLAEVEKFIQEQLEKFDGRVKIATEIIADDSCANAASPQSVTTNLPTEVEITSLYDTNTAVTSGHPSTTLEMRDESTRSVVQSPTVPSPEETRDESTRSVAQSPTVPSSEETTNAKDERTTSPKAACAGNTLDTSNTGGSTREEWHRESNGFRYMFFGEAVDYNTAKSRCAEYGGRLAAAGLRNATTRRKIKNLIPTPFVDTWIGLDDLVKKGEFIWSDCVKSDKNNTDWHPDEPGDTDNACGTMTKYRRRQVADDVCSLAKAYLCESL